MSRPHGGADKRVHSTGYQRGTIIGRYQRLRGTALGLEDADGPCSKALLANCSNNYSVTVNVPDIMFQSKLDQILI